MTFHLFIRKKSFLSKVKKSRIVLQYFQMHGFAFSRGLATLSVQRFSESVEHRPHETGPQKDFVTSLSG